MVEVNIYYQEYRERTEIDVIRDQKQSVILEILQLAYYNPEIDWRTEGKYDEMSREVWKVVKAKAEKTRISKTKRRGEERKKRKKRKEEEVEAERKEPKRERIIKVKRVAEEQKIWVKEKEVAKSEEEAKKLVPSRFHKWIYIFRKKTSERMLTKKLWNHPIEVKKEFVPRRERYIHYQERREKKYISSQKNN